MQNPEQPVVLLVKYTANQGIKMQKITIELAPSSELVAKNLESIKSGHRVIYLPLWSPVPPGSRTLGEAARELGLLDHER